jgi:hypothetical protein
MPTQMKQESSDTILANFLEAATKIYQKSQKITHFPISFDPITAWEKRLTGRTNQPQFLVGIQVMSIM